MKNEHLTAAQSKGLELTCALSFEAAEPVGEKPVLPRFRMVAYTGSMMHVGGWRYQGARAF